MLEVGCGEGIFTARLAVHCRSLLAVDVSQVALERAERRCAAYDHVRFARWDLRTDPPLGEFDVVACMDTVEYIRRPFAKRRAIAKLIGSVAPGGVILVSAVIQNPLIERAVWDQWLLQGGATIVAQFRKAAPDLVERAIRMTDRHIVGLYERAVP
jgi:2-polyprenyl-3-methyl-5-hydroxy-6-metoxy-1,4-benzoquinol methylase